MILAGAVLALATMVAADFADARRFGGGKSLGAQRQSVTPQPAAPSGAASQPVMPAQPGATLPGKPAAAAAPAASGASRWLGPIAGLAAGLGIAALLSHFGLSDEFASLLLVALLVGAAVFLVRMFLARRNVPQRPLQYAGGAGTTGAQDQARPVSPAFGGPRVEPVLGAATSTPLADQRFPSGFDAEAFVRNAKQQFIALQAANDATDRKTIAGVTTPKMYAELAAELEGRGPQAPTEVVTLDAEVLEVVTEGREHWASVRYTGTLREDGALLPSAFDEVWHLTKPVDGSSGWLLAGIQQRS
jgi:predicted lipid-binding transport protein (Tim44 family)